MVFIGCFLPPLRTHRLPALARVSFISSFCIKERVVMMRYLELARTDLSEVLKSQVWSHKSQVSSLKSQDRSHGEIPSSACFSSVHFRAHGSYASRWPRSQSICRSFRRQQCLHHRHLNHDHHHRKDHGGKEVHAFLRFRNCSNCWNGGWLGLPCFRDGNIPRKNVQRRVARRRWGCESSLTRLFCNFFRTFAKFAPARLRPFFCLHYHLFIICAPYLSLIFPLHTVILGFLAHI